MASDLDDLFRRLNDLRMLEEEILRQIREHCAQQPPRALELAAAQTPAALMFFPTAGQPHQWPLTDTLVNGWRRDYPNVDVLAECRKAHAWVQANTKKTAKGMPRFLNAWLARAQDRAGGSGPGRQFFESNRLTPRTNAVLEGLGGSGKP